ncbi:protein jag [Alkalibacter rhizosphaerae]|uniref:RNA-binding protein KhpB n=1 Tax=Alkalibacter rhizosphaerae TaxID=2815577 RepID=A0A974XKD7_9FIRM|nr:RNA-binding cell elongation regulator Jag/EloR [Alkalibacter rhizosphaerae]QSX07576.1 protein jag [Alkalibacter rhizosphaerae]
MKKVVSEGRTVEEAIEKALKELQATNDQVNKKILEMPSKGIMGIFGVKNAKVEVSMIEDTAKDADLKVPAKEEWKSGPEKPVKDMKADVKEEKVLPKGQGPETPGTIEEKAEHFLGDIFEKFGIVATCTTVLDQRHLSITLEGEDMGILIGRRGQTLDAIQYLTSLVVNKATDEYVRVVIDTENYREKREATLKDLAHKLAKKVERTRKKVVLEPMNPYERRIIHATLQNHKRIYTYSEGEEPFRKVVIDLKKTS